MVRPGDGWPLLPNVRIRASGTWGSRESKGARETMGSKGRGIRGARMAREAIGAQRGQKGEECQLFY